VEQRAAVHTEAVRADHVVAQVEQGPPGGVRAAQPGDLGAHDAHPEPLEHLYAGRLQQDARAHRTGLGGLLEHRHPMAVARQQQRRRAAGGAGADHCDVTH
jgi:hypothetical protein